MQRESTGVTAANLLGRIIADPESVLGDRESQILDFKSMPPNLDTDRARIEFAKDLAAFANSGGGLLVYGVRSALDQSSEEMASELAPFPDQLWRPQQLRDAVEPWIYPMPELQFNAISVEGGCIGTILVLPSHSNDAPFIVTRAELQEGGTVSRVAVSFFQRTGSTCRPLRPEDIHRRVHTNWGIKREVERVGNEEPGESNSNPITDPLTQVLESLGIVEGEGYLAAQLAVLPSQDLQDFWGDDTSGLPGSFHARPLRRQHGFGFRNDIRSLERIAPDRIQAFSAHSNSISVTKQGVVSVIQRQDHLTWASGRRIQNPEDGLALNLIAVTELLLEECQFFLEDVAPRAPQDHQIGFSLHLHGAAGPYPLVILDTNGNPHTTLGRDRCDTDWTIVDEAPTPGRLALVLLECLFGYFGLPRAQIAFVSEDGNSIDPDQLPI